MTTVLSKLAIQEIARQNREGDSDIAVLAEMDEADNSTDIGEEKENQE